MCVCVQEPRFVSGEEKAFKLVDLKDFTVYSDSELFGELEGQALVVCVCVCVGGEECVCVWVVGVGEW